MPKLNMLSPWNEYYNKLTAFFKEDEEVTIVFDESKIKVFVRNNHAKAEALKYLLPSELVFASMTIPMEIIPANDEAYKSRSQCLDICINKDNALSHIPDIIDCALGGNYAKAYIKTVEGIFSNPITYVVFKKVVVQYFTDNLRDINGKCSTLYQTLAKEIFGTYDGVFYCTDNEDTTKYTVSSTFATINGVRN